MIYLNSARSFSSKLIGNKIEAIIFTFKKQVEVDLICGKDFVFWKKNLVSYGNMVNKNPSQNIFFIKRYISEILDVIHDVVIFFILFSYKNNKIIWERGSRLHISGFLFSKIMRITYVYEWKDNLYLTKYNLLGYLHQLYECVQLKYSNFIIVESDILRNELEIKFKIDRNKIYVAFNSINPIIFKSDINRLDQHKVTIGYIGSYAYYHNVDLYAGVLNKFANKDVNWEFIGAGGNCEFIKNKLFGSESKILFRAPVSGKDVPAAISHWSVAVLPGATEIISPIKIAEFLALGLPVIVPNSPAIIEQFGADYALVYFNKNDEISLNNAINFMLENLEKFLIKARNDMLLVSQKFSFDSTWGHVLKDIILIEKKL